MARIIRLPEVEAKVGLKKSEIYEKIGLGEFPRQVRLSPKTVGWIEHEIDAWIDSRMAERDAGHANRFEGGANANPPR